MSMGVSVTFVTIAALLADKITLSLAQVLVIWAVLILGTIPFSTIGLPSARSRRGPPLRRGNTWCSFR